MRALGKWSIKNTVSVNLIMVFILVAGLVTVMKMRREMMPQFALDMIFVSVDYPGSSPEEVEEGICIKIEEQIEGIEGIDRMISTAREGNGEVVVELESGTDVQKVLDEIKAEVDRIDTFPEEAEEPLVLEIINRDPTIYIAAYGDVAERNLRQAAEKIRDDLLDPRIVSQMEMKSGADISEIQVKETITERKKKTRKTKKAAAAAATAAARPAPPPPMTTISVSMFSLFESALGFIINNLLQITLPFLGYIANWLTWVNGLSSLHHTREPEA